MTDKITLCEESQSQWIAGDKEHLRYEYDLSPSDLVIDIGAHEGEFSKRIFGLYGCKVIAIEPNGYIAGFTDGEVINKAASTFEGYESFGGLSLYTSVYAPITNKYPCFDINSLLRQHAEIALVKINIEGGEYKLLSHIIDAGLHERIRNLQVQFHCIDGEPVEELYGAIESKLSLTHKRTWFYPFCWENWRRL